MNKKTFASFALLGSLVCSQAAFASNDQALIQNQQYSHELTKENLLGATQDYLLEQVEQLPQGRSSALFAKILDTMSKNAILAQADSVKINVES